MENPNVLEEQDPKTSPLFKFSNKLLIILSIFIILVIGIYFSLPYFSHYLPFLKEVGIKSKVQPKLIKQTKLSNLPVENHPQLFIASLVFNSKTSGITRVKTGGANGDFSPYLSSPPKTLPGDLLFKVEVLGSDGSITTSGFKFIPSEVLVKDQDNVGFMVSAPFIKGGQIKLYNSDGSKLFWTGKML